MRYSRFTLRFGHGILLCSLADLRPLLAELQEREGIGNLYCPLSSIDFLTQELLADEFTFSRSGNPAAAVVLEKPRLTVQIWSTDTIPEGYVGLIDDKYLPLCQLPT